MFTKTQFIHSNRNTQSCSYQPNWVPEYFCHDKKPPVALLLVGDVTPSVTQRGLRREALERRRHGGMDRGSPSDCCVVFPSVNSVSSFWQVRTELLKPCAWLSVRTEASLLCWLGCKRVFNSVKNCETRLWNIVHFPKYHESSLCHCQHWMLPI